MRLTVLVPTYRRPDMLDGCLKAIAAQERPADEVLVIVRDIDTETQAYLATDPMPGLPLKAVPVTVPGQVAAMNAGLDAMTGDVVCITDDDAAPFPQWLARIETNFEADPKLGGLGGRDWIYENGKFIGGETDVVGKLFWYGRCIGNHHLSIPGTPQVQIIKGANMSYRSTAIGDLRFDTRLKGTGAQVHNDLAFAFAIQRKGWILKFDETAAVNHYIASRHDEDARYQFNPEAYFNQIYNETFVIKEHLPAHRFAAYLLWKTIIGTRANYGLLQVLRFAPKERANAFRKFLVSLKGTAAGLRVPPSA
ncbi:MAG: glycosyltransferase [Armatimonas sp.]